MSNPSGPQASKQDSDWAPPRRDRSRRRFEENKPQRKEFARDEGHLDRTVSFNRRPSVRRDSSYSCSSRSPSPVHRAERRRPRRYEDYSRSPSPRRRRDSSTPSSPNAEKEWYRKKTLWAAAASVATICALLPTAASAKATHMSSKATRGSADATRTSARATQNSARATQNSAKAVNRSADATIQSAQATLRAAQAAERSAKAAERTAQAASNTARANGHQDHRGRFLGSNNDDSPARGSQTSRARKPLDDGFKFGEQKLLEYEPFRQAMMSADVAAGVGRA